MWPIRSFLFVPSHRVGWVAKALKAAPQAVILDMEDAVPPAEKATARAMLAGSIAELHAAGTAAFVRINPLNDGGDSDVAACVAPGLDGVVLPKASSTAEIAELHDLLSYHEGRAGVPKGQVCILPLPETAEGIHDAYDLAIASDRVRGIFGTVGGPLVGDVARAAGFRPTMAGLEQLYMNSKLVLDSRAAGAVYPVALIMGTKIDDLAATEALCRRAKEIGYTGLIMLHPDHIAIADRVMRPTDEDIAYYDGMLAAFAEAEAKGQGAVLYRGLMVDYAMLPYAREIVAEGRRR